MYEQIMFGGLNDYQEPPKNYRRLQRRHGVDNDPRTLMEVIDHLDTDFGIEWRDLQYVTPGGGADDVTHYRALVNPAWEGKPSGEIPGDRKDAVWHIPTKRYTLAGHDKLGWPLYDAIQRRGEGEQVFGTCRVRREGGEVHMDVFFKGVDVPGGTDDITLGISTGHDYYGNTRMYADAIAYHDTGDGVGQIMRYLFDPKRRKHTGAGPEEAVDWYDVAIGRLGKASDRLHNVVAEAMNYEVPLNDLPCSMVGFFEHLGLPNRGDSTLADPAAKRLAETVPGDYTAWDMHKAAMWAIEHEFDPRDTSAFKKHVSKANLLLFNPALAEKRVLKEIEETINERPDEHEVWDFVDKDDAGSGLEDVRQRALNVSEGVEDFENTRERLTSILTDAESAEA